MRPYKLQQYFCLIINLLFIMASHEGIIIAGSFLLIILLIEEFIFFNKTNILAKRIASFLRVYLLISYYNTINTFI